MRTVKRDMFLLKWILLTAAFWQVGSGVVEQCDREDGLCSTEEPRLIIRSPVQVGHLDELDVDPDRTLYRRTASIRPPIFEINNFLTSEECDHLKNLALSKGLEESVTYRNTRMSNKKVAVMDIDGNRLLDLNEMRLIMENSFDVYLGEEDAVRMYKDLAIDKNNDGLVCPEELSQLNLDDLQNWLKKYVAKKPVTRSRTSRQIWLYSDRKTDPVIRTIQDRVTRLTGLAPRLIEDADLQIVHYKSGGHYHAHYDSSDRSDRQPCCTKYRKQKDGCRICRFMTVLFYLNDVEEGGGTAFPVADNKTFNINELRVNHLVNLREHCHDANVLVAPSRGKAVMWYNHQVEPQTGWTGPMEEQSIHGGCPVIQGEKWIANFWIKTTDDKRADLKMLGL